MSQDRGTEISSETEGRQNKRRGMYRKDEETKPKPLSKWTLDMRTCVYFRVAFTGGTPAVEVIAYLGPEYSEHNYNNNCRLE